MLVTKLHLTWTQCLQFIQGLCFQFCCLTDSSQEPSVRGQALRGGNSEVREVKQFGQGQVAEREAWAVGELVPSPQCR